MRNDATVVIMISMAFALGACGKSRPFSKSPSDTIVAAYMAANEGKYSEAERYFSSDALNAMKGDLGALTGGMKGGLDEATRTGSIERIEILREAVRGEGANVSFRVHFKDGSTKDNNEKLLLENGVWKITL